MYLAYNEGKSLVVAERFIRSLKVKSIKKKRHVIVLLISVIKTNLKAPKFTVDD